MMQRWRTSKSMRRCVFIGINLGAYLVVALLIAAPVRAVLMRRDSQILEQRQLLARFKALAAQELAIPAATKEAAADTGEYLAGNNEGVVNADLQTHLKSLVEAAGAHLRTVAALPPQTASSSGTSAPARTSSDRYHPFTARLRRSRLPNPSSLCEARSSSRRFRPEPVLEAQLDVFGALRNTAGGR